jgi:hypothetical protein
MSYNCYACPIRKWHVIKTPHAATGYDYVTIQFLDETVVATLFVDEKRENQFSLRSVMFGNQLLPSSYPKVADTQDRAKVL